MKSTPINGWPVAQDTDPVKQYPASVDDPFKASLDTRVIPRFANAAARATAIPSPTAGMVSWLTDKSRLEYHDGTSWRAIVTTQVGAVVATTDGAGEMQITFPVAYTGQPTVVATPGDVTPAGATVSINVGTLTATGVKVRVFNASGSPITGQAVRINWMAGNAPLAIVTDDALPS